MRLIAALAFGAFATTFPRIGCVRQTTVELFNNTSSSLNVKVFYSSDQNVAEGLIDDVGSQLNYSIPAGQPQRFVLNCDDLQAIKVEGDLQVIAGFGPSDSTGVLRDGSNFDCGDSVIFTFTSPNPADLDIEFNKLL